MKFEKLDPQNGKLKLKLSSNGTGAKGLSLLV